MLSVVKLSPDKQSCNLSQLYHHEMDYRCSTIYILQLLQVSSDHHVTSILITLAQTIYNILYKVQQPKQHSLYNDRLLTAARGFSLLHIIQNDSGAHAASYSMSIFILSWFGGRTEGKGHHHCVEHLPLTRLRIIGYISFLHLYAFRDNFITNFVYILYVSVTPGHFVPTSISISWNTVLSKLVKCVL